MPCPLKMTAGFGQRVSGAVGRAFSLQERLRGWALVQAVALLAAAGFAYNGARILRESPRIPAPYLENFDQAMPWLGAALLATLVAAWQPGRPQPPRLWLAGLADFWRAHWLEALVFAGIIGFGIFMRLYRFGDMLPPADGLCCEENINGGDAYRALQGERPLLFPLGRWGSAAGFLLFGETTFGLRIFFPIMAIATLVAFYFLLRQLASAPAALFGLALYAAAWWPSLRSRQAAEGTIYAVVFALLLVRGLKTRSPPLLLGAGILAGLLSYEYEAYRFVPIIASVFLAAAAAREVVLRRPVRFEAARERALVLLSAAWRPALIFFVAAGIVVVPLIVGTSHGQDLYLTSVHRNTSGRGSLVADEWLEHAKWTAEIFLPVGPNDYATGVPRDVPGTELIDPLAAWLSIAGLIAGAVFCLRGYRFLFVAWVLITLSLGAFVLQNYAAWKFLIVVPLGLVLATLLVDDVRAVVKRSAGTWGTRVLGGLLVIGAAFSFWWNADTLFNDVAPSAAIQESYGGTQASIYTMCDYLRGRGDGNYAVAYRDARPIAGFAGPRNGYEEQKRSWGNAIWVCHDLEGEALAAPEEAWPLRGLPAGRITLAFADPLVPAEELIEQLNRAYPGLGEPDVRLRGPAETFDIIAYEFASAEELLLRGLWAEYTPAGASSATASGIDSRLSLEATALPLAPPFRVRWRGVVYLANGGRWGLQVSSAGPAEVLLDGQLVYRSGPEESEEAFPELVAGWHPVEIAVEAEQAGGELELAWVQPEGGRRAVPADDLFPLADISGWLHERSLGFLGDERRLVTQRLDFSPHFASAPVLTLQAPPDLAEAFLTEERWRGVWEVGETDDYLLSVEFLAGKATLVVDGEVVASEALRASGRGRLEAELRLDAGRHAVELVQEFERPVSWSGGVISASRGGGQQREPVPLRVTPY